MKKLVLVMVSLLAVLAFLAGCAERETAVAGKGVYEGRSAERRAVTLDQLNRAEWRVSNRTQTIELSPGLNCDGLCGEIRKTCIEAYMGTIYSHDTGSLVTWYPFRCTDTRPYDQLTDLLRCRCY